MVVEVDFLFVLVVVAVVDFDVAPEVFLVAEDSISGAATTFFGRPRFLATTSGMVDIAFLK